MRGWNDPAHSQDCDCEDCRPRFSDRGKVDAWRLHELLEAGYGFIDARLIATSKADLHEACELVSVRGCPPATAAKIIL